MSPASPVYQRPKVLARLASPPRKVRYSQCRAPLELKARRALSPLGILAGTSICWPTNCGDIMTPEETKIKGWRATWKHFVTNSESFRISFTVPRRLTNLSSFVKMFKGSLTSSSHALVVLMSFNGPSYSSGFLKKNLGVYHHLHPRGLEVIV